MTFEFKDLKLIPALQDALSNKGYVTPTPIQEKAIPGLLEGKDLIGIAQTGTGKTAAFVLPILQRMKEQYPRKLKTLILAPTRELAAQIGESFSTYGRFLKFKHTVVFGGVPQGKQVSALSKGVDILVATPGRLLDLMNQKKAKLNDIEFLVLDEADRMLDMGFINDIKKILAKIPRERQSLFFSATMSPNINRLANSLLRDPVHVEVTPQATTVEIIAQQVFFVDQKEKEKLLLKLLEHEHLTSILIFTRTKHRANKVAAYLNENKIAADAIHGNKAQNARVKAMRAFKSGKVKVLVATDIAARGIDIDNISHVINFELPNEPESYVHRIGRTARAGKDGTAFSFCAADERNFLRDIEKLIQQKIEVMDHHFHSESAKNAVGNAAKPAPRRNQGRFAKPKARTHFKPKKTSPRRGNDERKFKPRTGTKDSEFKPRSGNKFKPKTGSKFKPKSGSSFKGKSESKFKPKTGSTFKRKPKRREE
jgi:ATP-dependent RNA helicase RhlE